MKSLAHHNMELKLFAIILFTGLPFSACRPVPAQTAPIMTGCEQTQRYLPLLNEKSVALVANHTTLINHSHLVDTLLVLGIKVTCIFSPEHGFRGEAGAGETVTSTRDPGTGIPVISLYGSQRKPAVADMQGIDLVIYDIQDVGVRFYTYISTLHYMMEACAESNIPLLILDRPNPLGYYVDGPVLKKPFQSFVGMHPIPVVYGMTVGELALMINGEGWLTKGLHCDLTVIPCSNYDHNTYYDLPVNPSPNLNSMEAVYLYPSLCFFEGTIMSLGRGTDTPFRIIGHPEYPVKTCSFTPRANQANPNPVFLGETCYGIDLRSIPVEQLKQMKQINLQWLMEVYDTMGGEQDFFTGYFDKLAGTDSVRKLILGGSTEAQIRQGWSEDLNHFIALRKKYLLYRDFND